MYFLKKQYHEKNDRFQTNNLSGDYIYVERPSYKRLS